MNIDIQEIIFIAKTAGVKIMKFYYDGCASVEKADGSPCTEADLASEQIIKNGLAPFGIPILSEETVDDKSRIDAEYVWVVDPLDGTMDFMQKTGEFAVMIGLVQNKKPILGVVFAPALDELYFAQEGQGAFFEQKEMIKQIHVSDKKVFSDMTILLSRNHLLEAEKKLSEQLDLKKMPFGSAGLKMGRIAAGDAEIYVNSSDKSSEWDTCASTIILQEAGGTITDLSGRPLFYNNEQVKHLQGYMATNGTQHEELIKTLKEI